tara:strand:+ start:526 stop:807 length:282 start_codon:yes stop_codon:yes gene_type:complete
MSDTEEVAEEVIEKNEEEVNAVSIIIGLIYTLVCFFAIFLSFKCNEGKFAFGGFLAALCCSPFYIAYKLGTSMDKCFPPKLLNTIVPKPVISK